MNLQTKYMLLLVLFIVYVLNNMKTTEKFTSEEMKKYPELLEANCKKTSETYEKLKEMNKKRCKQNGNTQRETINNKSLCYDDTAKEIVSRLDAISNCGLLKRDKKILLKKLKDVKTVSKVEEGPEFINTFYMPLYEPHKSTEYASYTLDKPLGVNNKYANVNEYSDVNFSSDPTFLNRLSKLKDS